MGIAINYLTFGMGESLLFLENNITTIIQSEVQGANKFSTMFVKKIASCIYKSTTDAVQVNAKVNYLHFLEHYLYSHLCARQRDCSVSYSTVVLRLLAIK